MDFMKVFDQTVREIKREVNLRVLKVPETEQKVLDATSDEPWGPHGSVLAELAQETKKFTECQMVMNILWTRLSETGANWRHVYKALTIIEYLVANGSERAVDDIIEHTFQISSLSAFEYVEPSGKDMGINVRKKVETISGLLNDREKIKAVRDKAAATRDKYIGLSSSGITYKASSASFGSSSFTNGGYGGLGGSKEDQRFKDSYKDKDHFDDESGSEHKTERGKSRESNTRRNEGNKSEKGSAHRNRDQHSLSTSKASAKKVSVPCSTTAAAQNNNEDDFDDFNPRGSSTSGSDAANFYQVDLFGDSLIGGFMDAPMSIPTETVGSERIATPEVDLFEDASFVSALPLVGIPAGSHNTIDLFATQTAMPATLPPQMDLFDMQISTTATASKPLQSEPTNADISFDPFAAVPLNTFKESDVFGAFTSNTNPMNSESSENSVSGNLSHVNQPASTTLKQPTKDNFQVKSGIWADSLSRGLIDLNITAPKKTSLADIRVVGGLGDSSDENERGLPTSGFMGRAMGIGTGLGKSSFSSATSTGGTWDFSSFAQQQ